MCDTLLGSLHRIAHPPLSLHSSSSSKKRSSRPSPALSPALLPQALDGSLKRGKVRNGGDGAQRYETTGSALSHPTLAAARAAGGAGVSTDASNGVGAGAGDSAGRVAGAELARSADATPTRSRKSSIATHSDTGGGSAAGGGAEGAGSATTAGSARKRTTSVSSATPPVSTTAAAAQALAAAASVTALPRSVSGSGNAGLKSLGGLGALYWTQEEDAQLEAAIESLGTEDWTRIASLVRGRTAQQCACRSSPQFRGGVFVYAR